MFVRCAAAAAALALTAGCTKPNPTYCDDGERPCETGVCDLASHTCIEVDGTSGDDAPPPDAPRAVVATNQPADLVLGQSSFATETDPGCTAVGLNATAVGSANNKLYVRDGAGARVLVWTPVPTIANAEASFALGQADLLSCSSVATSSRSVGSIGGIAAANGKLLIADSSRNRVLVWITPPTANNAPAPLVLGQHDFTSASPGNAADQLMSPTAVWTDGTRIVVAEQNGNRVMIWSSYPSGNGTPADVVIGQPGFGTSDLPEEPSDSNVAAPSGVTSDGTRLFVADSAHNRVLIWSTFPTTNGQPADIVLGQADFTHDGSGLSPTTMFGPHGMAVIADALFVADIQNDRILVFSPIPTESGTAATYVLGQTDLDSGANNLPPSQTSIDAPRDLWIDDLALWVTDEGHNRLLRFSLYPDG